MKFPNVCCRCGFCCLHETCPIGMYFYKISKDTVCLGLSFTGNIANCALLSVIPIGDGCCIKARVYKDRIEFDFSALPVELKTNCSKSLRKQKERGM